jgi:hypothetical protein
MALQGKEKLIDALTKLGPAAAELGGRALYQIGEEVMTEAKGLTPVDTGALRASGQVLPPVQRGKQIIVTLGFGNASVGYAIPVHERMDVHHAVGQAKFLEQPVLARSKTLANDLAVRLAPELPNAAR